MSDHNMEQRTTEEQTVGRREMSRRQFLNYTLGGTGAFMASMPLLWNLRFAVDPLLQPSQPTEWVKVIPLSELTREPQKIDFEVHVVDGWYEHDPKMETWISLDENGNVLALSPVCKHLGCTVNWNGSPQHPNEYFCPCHGAHYTPQGKALAIAKLPLDQYEVRVDDDGWVSLGKVIPNQIVK